MEHLSPGYLDYLMVLAPSESVIKTISGFKLKAAELIGSYPGMMGKAHLTLAHHYQCKPYLINYMLVYYQRKLINLPPVTIHINGFGYFKHGDAGITLFAKIDQHDIQNWFLKLRKILGMPGKSFTPHITIAKSLDPANFKSAWLYFESLSYIDHFDVNRMVILEKPSFGTEIKKWRNCNELIFRG